MVQDTPFGTPENLPAPRGQGPEWLTQIILNPPTWINDSLKAISVLVAVVVAYRLYHRGFEIELDTQIEIQRVVTHVLGVMIAGLAFVTYLDLPYAWDAAGSALVGVTAAFASQAVAARIPPEYVSTDARERVMAAWFVLTVGALVLPPLAGLAESGLLVVNARWYLVLLCSGLVLYNAALIHREQNSTGG